VAHRPLNPADGAPVKKENSCKKEKVALDEIYRAY
jgi:hypothetical protein